jgi:hypothetical protein
MYFTSQPHPPFQQDPFPQQPQQPSQPPSQPPSAPSQPVRERDQSRDPSHPGPHRVGAPLNFATGQFAGKHVRAQLIELQKADLGRK